MLQAPTIKFAVAITLDHQQGIPLQQEVRYPAGQLQLFAHAGALAEGFAYVHESQIRPHGTWHGLGPASRESHSIDGRSRTDTFGTKVGAQVCEGSIGHSPVVAWKALLQIAEMSDLRVMDKLRLNQKTSALGVPVQVLSRKPDSVHAWFERVAAEQHELQVLQGAQVDQAIRQQSVSATSEADLQDAGSVQFLQISDAHGVHT